MKAADPFASIADGRYKQAAQIPFITVRGTIGLKVIKL